MKVCKRDGCNNEVSNKATWCSDKCRKAASRTKTPDKTEVGQVKSDTVTEPYLTADQLAEAGLDYNRVPVPGDPDYTGVCKQVDGKWTVDKTVEDIDQPAMLDYDSLPPGVTRPYTGPAWAHTPQYQQTINNLMTMSVEQLKSIGQMIPQWKVNGAWG